MANSSKIIGLWIYRDRNHCDSPGIVFVMLGGNKWKILAREKGEIMKKIVCFLLVCVSMVLVVVSNASAFEWDLDPAFIYQNKFYSGSHVGYNHHKLKPVVVENQFGAYFRAEQLGDAVIEIYQTPNRWREVSHNFSQGGANLFGVLIFDNDCIYLPKGEYILKIIAGDNVSDIRMIFGPRLKP